MSAATQSPPTTCRHYSIEDFFARFGYELHTLRYWAQKGIVPPPATHYVRPGGHRVFLAVPEAAPERPAAPAPDTGTPAQKVRSLLDRHRKRVGSGA